MRARLFLLLFSPILLGKVSAQMAEIKAPVNQLIFHIPDKENVPNASVLAQSGFNKLRCEDKDFRLYSISYASEYTPNDAIVKLRTILGNAVVQKANLVTRRYGSNDPLAGNQQYLNVIHAYQTWDYGRGGVTRRGDTIVVAVIDDGMDTLHPDLAANVWKNRLEIPWNGIDDDGNGYVDDYYGWNGGDSNNLIYTSQTAQNGHGTSVAGVIGAVGDNGIGVTGINWNVKVMPVLCYPKVNVGTDIGVIRSFLYVFRMKKLWLETKGAKGANIMVANTSIGIDRSFPSDAPLWCAMYDSLGSVGIVSAGATANVTLNVDLFGDIPSTCPSPYLLIVKITDNNDEVVASGFGKVNVDLSAPGQDIYTTILRAHAGAGQPYANKSGTSFSTPIVAGAMSLLFSTACDTFLALLEHNNDSALALMRYWILAGTQKKEVLQGLCTSGGRLYIENSRLLMDSWCMAHDKVYSTSAAILKGQKLFPNPVMSGAEVYFTSPMLNHGEMQIRDCTGRVVLRSKVVEGQSIQVDLPPGIYYYQMQGNTAGKLQVY